MMNSPTLVTLARHARLAVAASFQPTSVPLEVAGFLEAIAAPRVASTVLTGFGAEPRIMFLRVETWYAEPFSCAWG
jgi:hypothetical protein